MAQPRHKQIAAAVLADTSESLAGELGVNIRRNTPAPLYQWLICSLLFSARISSDLAGSAARALFAKGWRTPDKMAKSTWKQRVEVLNRSGYARYDESTAEYIGATTRLLRDDYSGDMRKLREAAGCKPEEERALIRQFKGIGDTGVDIFFREAQLVWPELYPFADAKALEAACKFGLPEDVEDLSRLVDRQDFPRFLAGLMDAKAEDRDRIRQSAAA